MISPPTTPERPFQFRLRHMFILITGLAVVLAAFAQLGVQAIWPLLILSLALFALYILIWQRQWTGLLLLGMIVAALAVLLLPAVGSRPPGKRSLCSMNLLQIGLALHEYHEVYGSYPPAYVADKDGKPMHSWRVLLLPFLGYDHVYQRYRFDEPWDGPNNRNLAALAKDFAIFSCPALTPGGLTGETSYVVVIGAHTAFPGEKCISRSDIKDDPAHTIMVVEVRRSAIHWMEPRDLHELQMTPIINAKSGQGISSNHKDGAEALTADTATHHLPADSISPELLRALLSINGGENAVIP